MKFALPAGPVSLRRLHAGPLGVHASELVERLAGLGYARSTLREQVRLVAVLSNWLGRRELGGDDIDDRVVDQFFKGRRRHGWNRSSVSMLKVLLQHLRDMKVIAPLPSAEDEGSPLVEIERRYAEYLTRERGLAPITLAGYLPTIRKFLAERFGSGSPVLGELRPADISSFLLQHAHVGSPGRAKLLVCALRSFFRFLHLRGETTTDLAVSVPPVMDWKLSTLPKFISSDQVEQLLKSCDRSTALGLRNYAILLLLARLGLRAGEVVAMELEDFDWAGGQLMVRGKGRRRDRLPIPQDVGEAVVMYLRQGRPHCSSRRVFICQKAPLRGFANSIAICSIVQRTIDRAGIQSIRKGAHLLRHSLATRMLRQGASFAEIGEILRHQLPNTTEIYAKVDVLALAELAQPWPGGEV